MTLRARNVLPLLGALVLLVPRPAHADNLEGLAVVVSGLFVGLPAAAVLLGLLFASRSRARRGVRAPSWAAGVTVFSSLLVLAVPVASFLLGGESGPVVGLSLLAAAPLLLLALLTIRAARQVGR